MEKVKDFGLISGSSNHPGRIATIRRVYEEYGILVDPHTADGLKVGLEHREAGVPLIFSKLHYPSNFPKALSKPSDVNRVALRDMRISKACRNATW